MARARIKEIKSILSGLGKSVSDAYAGSPNKKEALDFYREAFGLTYTASIFCRPIAAIIMHDRSPETICVSGYNISPKRLVYTLTFPTGPCFIREDELPEYMKRYGFPVVSAPATVIDIRHFQEFEAGLLNILPRIPIVSSYSLPLEKRIFEGEMKRAGVLENFTSSLIY